MVKNKENKAKKETFDEKSVETEKVEKKVKKKSFSFSKVFFMFILLLIIAGLASTHLPFVKKHLFSEGNKEVDLAVQVLQGDVLSLENGLDDLKKSTDSDVDLLRQKLDSLEKHNLNVITSKADNATILGVIQRLDNVEVRLNEVAKVSDNGALIATATMLVKDAAERGSNYIYELSVLRSLAEGEPKLLPYLGVLSKYDEKGVYSEIYLTNEFNKIYSLETIKNNQDKPIEPTDDFMTKFNKKFGKIMTIKYRNAEEVKAVNLDDVYVLVNAQDFSRVVFELEKPQYQEILEANETLRLWVQNVKSRQEFYDAISKLTAYSLGIMKANQFKN
ncbi:MAG: hypothetical protein PHE89_01590 [Alphaproteobacteria bacterium]|nr:hypothetical protein [Alphaproteobacteria bacterium]